jgi:hypothetical protein
LSGCDKLWSAQNKNGRIGGGRFARKSYETVHTSGYEPPKFFFGFASLALAQSLTLPPLLNYVTHAAGRTAQMRRMIIVIGLEEHGKMIIVSGNAVNATIKRFEKGVQSCYNGGRDWTAPGHPQDRGRQFSKVIFQIRRVFRNK